jgi:hypothetical protein
MKKFISKNIHLILAFGIPLLLVLIVAIFVYMPSVFLKSNYDFIYISCDEGSSYPYNCVDYVERKYSVKEGVLSINHINQNADYNNDGKPDFSKEYKIRFFLHDNKKNESREITEKEAQEFHLNDLITSPEGMSITNGYNGGASFYPVFNTKSSFNHYLTKGNNRKKLNLIVNNNSYRRNNFQFIGWIIDK